MFFQATETRRRLQIGSAFHRVSSNSSRGDRRLSPCRPQRKHSSTRGHNHETPNTTQSGNIDRRKNPAGARLSAQSHSRVYWCCQTVGKGIGLVEEEVVRVVSGAINCMRKTCRQAEWTMKRKRLEGWLGCPRDLETLSTQ